MTKDAETTLTRTVKEESVTVRLATGPDTPPIPFVNATWVNFVPGGIAVDFGSVDHIHYVYLRDTGQLPDIIEAKPVARAIMGLASAEALRAQLGEAIDSYRAALRAQLREDEA